MCYSGFGTNSISFFAAGNPEKITSVNTELNDSSTERDCLLDTFKPKYSEKKIDQMAGIVDAQQIEDDMEEAQLRAQYEQLVKEVHQKELLISVIQNVNVDEIKDISDESKKNIEKSLDFIRAYPCLKLDNTGANVLGIQAEKPHELSYVEQKALKEKILADLPKHYTEQLELIDSMEPEVVNPQILDGQLLELSARERELTVEVAVKKAKYCQLLKECVDLKFGDEQQKEAELNNLNVTLCQAKAELIKGIMFDSARNLNPDAAKAYEEVEKYIDGEIAKCMRSEGSKTKDDSKHV